MGLTQEELAQRTGIEALVISDLEEADYVGNSLEMLQKIIKTASDRGLHVGKEWRSHDEWQFKTLAETTEEAPMAAKAGD